MQYIAFRVDASIEMGSGHVMRCLTLADALKTQQRECLFLTRPHPGDFSDTIAERGHRVILLSKPQQFFQKHEDDVDHAQWLGASQSQDAQETISALTGIHPNWLVVDHYAIDHRWHKLLRSHVKNILVIDDLADRVYDCDLLLDQTFGRKETDYRKLVNKKTPLLLGSQYALLRPEFAKLRPEAIVKRKEYKGIRRILVSMGGTDPHNVTTKVLQGLMTVEWQDQPIVDVVLSSKAPYLNKIIEQAKQSLLDVEVSVDVNNMAEYILKADLAIGAAGTSSWERCCLGLPTLIDVNVKNQEFVSKSLCLSNAVKMMRTQESFKTSDVKESVEYLIRSEKSWQAMSKEAFKITRGLGAKRIGLEMNPPFSRNGSLVRIRPIKDEDLELLYEWQSDPQTRRYSHNSDVPTYIEHIAWVKKRIHDLNVFTEIILQATTPVGVIRLDPVNKASAAFLVSIYISPEFYQLGIGKAALENIFRLMPNAELRAEIYDDNIASKALFTGKGFESRGNMLYVKQPENKGEGA